jgi:protein gp37
MAEQTSILWTDHTFNPWRGCTKVSDGCKFCYAEAQQDLRLKAVHWGPNGTRVVAAVSTWREPLTWNRAARRAGERRRVFCASLADVFEDRPDLEQPRARLWELINQTTGLDWLLLTKRAHRIAECLPADWGSGWPNVWLGTSVENKKDGLPRIEHLRRIPAVVHFLSAEPLLEDLGPIDLTGIDWVIVGGESGRNYRPMDHMWARGLRDHCRRNGVAFFFKQSAGSKPGTGIDLDGEVIQEFPTPACAAK